METVLGAPAAPFYTPDRKWIEPGRMHRQLKFELMTAISPLPDFLFSSGTFTTTYNTYIDSRPGLIITPTAAGNIVIGFDALNSEKLVAATLSVKGLRCAATGGAMYMRLGDGGNTIGARSYHPLQNANDQIIIQNTAASYNVTNYRAATDWLDATVLGVPVPATDSRQFNGLDIGIHANFKTGNVAIMDEGHVATYVHDPVNLRNQSATVKTISPRIEFEGLFASTATSKTVEFHTLQLDLWYN